MWKSKPGVSVSRRLLALILFAALAELFVSVVAARSLRWVESESQHLASSQVRTTARIAAKLSAMLKALRPALGHSAATALDLQEIRKFHQESMEDWKRDQEENTEARRFRSDLEHAGQLALIQRRGQLLHSLSEALDRSDASMIINTLESLAALQSEVSEAIAKQVKTRVNLALSFLLVTCLVALALFLLLGYRVYQGIAPRVRLLVQKVKQFQEYGVNDLELEQSRDEISILTNALNSGFRAIEHRDAERENFLSIAAHELKTPLTTIQGYSSALLKYGNTPGLKERAASVIHSQVWRISRIVEEVLLSSKVHGGKWKFRSERVDLAETVKATTKEIQLQIPGAKVTSSAPDHLFLLGDEKLLENGITSLLIFASGLSGNTSEIHSSLKAEKGVACLEVFAKSENAKAGDVQDLFSLMNQSQFESESSGRLAMGLGFTRAVAKQHNGSMTVDAVPDQGYKFLLEIPL